MKNTMKLLIFFTILVVSLLIIPNFSNAANGAYDEESLNNLITNANSGETIMLENDITVTKPIAISKEIIINGNNHNLVGANSWTSTSGNQTMFTAQGSKAKITLKNINLRNGPKYGVQSYDGATVVLDKVSINGFKYGGVLVNGGNVEIINLHLGYNGTVANNGIEIGKGAVVKNNPTLIMNGTLQSDTNENIIRVAENDNLTEFTVTNTSNTNNKIFLTDEKIVLTDSKNNVIAESTVPDKVNTNIDSKKVIITLSTKNETKKITVEEGKNITADLLKSYITLEQDYMIEGFYIDSNYETEFNFNEPIDKDTTIYVKIIKTENLPETKPEDNNNEKDDTPKTGVENHLEIAILTIILSVLAIVYIKKKSNK